MSYRYEEQDDYSYDQQDQQGGQEDAYEEHGGYYEEQDRSAYERDGYAQEQNSRYQQHQETYEDTSYVQSQSHGHQQQQNFEGYPQGGQRGISGDQYQDESYQQSIQPGPQGSGTNLRRKSLLIGINYEGQDCALQGCRQDAQNMVNSSHPPLLVWIPG
jgi:hypothetical protein